MRLCTHQLGQKGGGAHSREMIRDPWHEDITAFQVFEQTNVNGTIATFENFYVPDLGERGRLAYWVAATPQADTVNIQALNTEQGGFATGAAGVASVGARPSGRNFTDISATEGVGSLFVLTTGVMNSVFVVALVFKNSFDPVEFTPVAAPFNGVTAAFWGNLSFNPVGGALHAWEQAAPLVMNGNVIIPRREIGNDLTVGFASGHRLGASTILDDLTATDAAELTTGISFGVAVSSTAP